MTDQAPTTERFIWTAVPLKGRLGATVFLLFLFPVLAAVVYVESGDVLLTVLAVAFVAVAISPAVLPTTYILEEEKITVKHLGRSVEKSWSAFKRLIVDRDVILLSPFAAPCFLDTFRGLYLRFNKDQNDIKEKALMFVLSRLPRVREDSGEK